MSGQNSETAAKITAAVVQMNSGADVSENLEVAASFIAEAAEQGAELIVLPECFACMQGDLKALGRDEVRNARIQNFLSEQARQQGVVLVGGTTPFGLSPEGREDSQRNWATCFVYGANGKQLARYDKIHLFDVDVKDDFGAYRESRDYHHGKQVVSRPAVGTHLGLSVCYDLRFPELYRQLSVEGARVISAPSAFTRVTGEAHWEVLVRARAIENQVFMLAANQCGTHAKGRETWGHSMIVSPSGAILSQAGNRPAVLVAELDLAEQSMLRRAMPCLRHRRL